MLQAALATAAMVLGKPSYELSPASPGGYKDATFKVVANAR